MSINEYWQKTLAYFGMSDDGYDEYDEYDDYDEHHDRETNARVRDDDYRDERSSRDRGSRRSSRQDDDFDEDTHKRVMANGIWNDHVSVQAALATIHTLRKAGLLKPFTGTEDFVQ